MAKLLQRVRGDAPSSPTTTTQPSGTPLNAPSRNSQARSTERTAPLAIPSAAGVEDSETNATGTQSTDSPAPAKRKAPSAAPQTDLGALRALANETARRAISRHELRKHRRNAVTKVIVATLAGVTSKRAAAALARTRRAGAFAGRFVRVEDRRAAMRVG